MYKLKWFESGIWCDKREGEETKAVQVRDGKELTRKKKWKEAEVERGWQRETRVCELQKMKKGTYYTTMEKGKESNKKKKKRVERDRYIISGK